MLDSEMPSDDDDLIVEVSTNGDFARYVKNICWKNMSQFTEAMLSEMDTLQKCFSSGGYVYKLLYGINEEQYISKMEALLNHYFTQIREHITQITNLESLRRELFNVADRLRSFEMSINDKVPVQFVTLYEKIQSELDITIGVCQQKRMKKVFINYFQDFKSLVFLLKADLNIRYSLDLVDALKNKKDESQLRELENLLTSLQQDVQKIVNLKIDHKDFAALEVITKKVYMNFAYCAMLYEKLESALPFSVPFKRFLNPAGNETMGEQTRLLMIIAEYYIKQNKYIKAWEYLHAALLMSVNSRYDTHDFYQLSFEMASKIVNELASTDWDTPSSHNYTHFNVLKQIKAIFPQLISDESFQDANDRMQKSQDKQLQVVDATEAEPISCTEEPGFEFDAWEQNKAMTGRAFTRQMPAARTKRHRADSKNEPQSSACAKQETHLEKMKRLFGKKYEDMDIKQCVMKSGVSTVYVCMRDEMEGEPPVKAKVSEQFQFPRQCLNKNEQGFKLTKLNQQNTLAVKLKGRYGQYRCYPSAIVNGKDGAVLYIYDKIVAKESKEMRDHKIEFNDLSSSSESDNDGSDRRKMARSMEPRQPKTKDRSE